MIHCTYNQTSFREQYRVYMWILNATDTLDVLQKMISNDVDCLCGQKPIEPFSTAK